MSDDPNFTLGPGAVDLTLNGGLARGRLHEVYAGAADDGASASGFAAMLASRACGAQDAVFWLRHERGEKLGGGLQASGLLELGLDPGRILFVMAPDVDSLLRAAVDAVRCGGLGAVVIEGWGKMPKLDLTASRRMKLAAERSGVTTILLRIDGEPVASAAETRWSVTSAPSSALEANAPGRPAFDIILLRRRAGPAGLTARLEWNRDELIFETPFGGACQPQPEYQPEYPARYPAEYKTVPRLMVPISIDRQGTKRSAKRAAA